MLCQILYFSKLSLYSPDIVFQIKKIKQLINFNEEIDSRLQ